MNAKFTTQVFAIAIKVCSGTTNGQSPAGRIDWRRIPAAGQQEARRLQRPMVGMGAWSVQRTGPAHQSDDGRISCNQIAANMQRYVTGQLPLAFQRAFVPHLANCPQCREKVEAMQDAAAVREQRSLTMRGRIVSRHLVLIVGYPGHFRKESSETEPDRRAHRDVDNRKYRF